MTRRRRSRPVVRDLSSAAVPCHEGRLLLVVSIVDDILDASLTVLQLADGGLSSHVRLGLAVVEGRVAGLAAAVFFAAEAPLVVPSHLIRMQIVMVREVHTFNHKNFNCRFSMRLNNKSLNFMYSTLNSKNCVL